MDPAATQRAGPSKSQDNIWTFDQGSLTIVDLSCPFVNENDACALFSICLSLFLENRNKVGRVVALDEAHKFLTQSGEAMKFTDQLVSIICQQRHLATRVFIATQEPTLSPRLLDLSNVSIVHRFLSPAWFKILKAHLAGASDADGDLEKLFQDIVALKTGEALVFSPTAMIDVDEAGHAEALGHQFFKMRVRKRLTADGGKSIMASDKSNVPEQQINIAFVNASVQAPTAPPQRFRPAGPSSVRPNIPSPPIVPPANPSGSGSTSTAKPLVPAGLNEMQMRKALKEATVRQKQSGIILDFNGVRRDAAVRLKLAAHYFTCQSKGWRKTSAEVITETSRKMSHGHG